ncbi:MAG: hypothetical protein MK198_13100 [Gracilimonas sp.]|uniref:hypothetical protein n=1 Tax=Gracilimonas sp. TaxID=1974203 RepID=UPI00375250EB|nr:hypothetical protein [Gracilimonas sp.]
MSDEQEKPDLEPSESSTETKKASPKGRRSLSNVKRELTEEELKSPAAQKLLVEELERVERERNELLDYRDNFYSVDKELSILQEKLNKNISIEVISSSCLAIGAAAIGLAPSIWEHEPVGWYLVVFGGVLIIAGIVAKAIKI